MSDKKRKIILIVLGVLIVLLIGAGVTYAYFEARVDQGAQGNVNVTGDTTDNLLFDVSNDISLTINQFNFGTGAGNLSSTAKATASLRANSTNNTATYNYFVYFKIDKNEYIYTTEDNKPEIVLSITDPTGNPVTEVEGLTYVNATNADGTVVSGFDITTASGLFAIASNYEITSNSSTEATLQEWTITATFINLATDQENNTGKTMSGKVMIQKDEYDDRFVSYIKKLYTTQGSNNLYHHDSTLINGANDGSYRYAGSYESTNNWVCFGTDAEKCDDEHLYRIIGVFNSIIIDDAGNATTEKEERVKLIKAYEGTSTSLGTEGHGTAPRSDFYPYKGKQDTIPLYYWSGSLENQKNVWATSTLNTDILNGTYLTTLGTTWTDKISVFKWMAGGNTTSKLTGVYLTNVYKNELVQPWSYANSIKKIGLMYVSDYTYTASAEYWQTRPKEFTADINNWLYLGVDEWTITRSQDYSTYVIYVNRNNLLTAKPIIDGPIVIRPAFYLNSNVKFVNGTGTEIDPYRIK